MNNFTQDVIELFNFEHPEDSVKQFFKSIVSDDVASLEKTIKHINVKKLKKQNNFVEILNCFVNPKNYQLLGLTFLSKKQLADGDLKKPLVILDEIKSKSCVTFLEKIKVAYLCQDVEHLQQILLEKRALNDCEVKDLANFVKNNFNIKGFEYLHRQNIFDKQSIKKIFDFIDGFSNDNYARFSDIALINKNQQKLYFLAKNPDFLKENEFFKRVDEHIKNLIIKYAFGFKDLMFKSLVSANLVKPRDILIHLLLLNEWGYRFDENVFNQYIHLFKSECKNVGFEKLKEVIFFRQLYSYNKVQLSYLENIFIGLEGYGEIFDDFYYLRERLLLNKDETSSLLIFCENYQSLIDAKEGIVCSTFFEHDNNDICNNNRLFLKNGFKNHKLIIYKSNLDNLIKDDELNELFFKKLNLKSSKVINALSQLLLSNSYQNNLISFVSNIPSKNKVDLFLKNIEASLIQSDLLIKIKYGKKFADVKINGSLFLTYLAAMFGSKKYLRKILCNKDIHLLMLNNGIYDGIMNDKKISIETKMVFQDFFKNSILKKEESLGKRVGNKRLKI